MNAILLIDDNAAHRRFFTRALDRAGLESTVLEATGLRHGREVIAKLGEKLALLVVDLNLGDGKGSDLVREMREKEAELPILVLSTSRLESDVRECYERGASCYLTKGDDPLAFAEELLKAVRFLLRESASS